MMILKYLLFTQIAQALVVNQVRLLRKRRANKRMDTLMMAVETRPKKSSSASVMSNQIRDMRQKMEEDEETSLMMQALRGQNMNDDDRQGEGISMQLIEMATMKDSELPMRYDPQALKDYFNKRPGAVAKRITQIGSTSFGLLLGLFQDFISGNVEKAQVKRAAELRKVLVSLGPFFIKLGQALSIRPDVLSPRAMTELQQLCDKVPSFDSEIAFAYIQNELGIDDISQVFSAITPEPVAAASLGQVYRAVLKNSGETVAVKVQRPFVLETVSLDLFLIRALGETLRTLGLAERFDIVELLDEFATRFYDELDYVIECQNGERVLREMQKLPNVKIPKNYPQLTTRRVHVAEWVEGEKLSQSKAADVSELVELGVVTYLTQLLDTGFFHADPHPGNMLRTNDGQLCILDFGLMTVITEDQKFGMIEAIAHLIHRDYERIGEDFVKLDFIPPNVDTRPIVPALGRVFDAALQGGGAKSINFNELAADLAEITFSFPFRIPPYFALVIRAIGVLEGIALVANKDFAIVDESYPWIARKLLTDPSPRMREALRYMVYGNSKRFDADRLVDMLQALERFQNVKEITSRHDDIHPGNLAPRALPGGSTSTALSNAIVPLQTIPQQSDSASAREALKFFFGKDGVLFRDFLLDEVVASLDAAARSAYRPSGNSRVDEFLRKLAPELDDDDRTSLSNAGILYQFFLDSRRGPTLSGVQRAGQSLGINPQTIRTLAPLLLEHRAELRLFSAQIFAKLAEKQIGRTLGAFVDVIAPLPPSPRNLPGTATS
uniref:Protein kinase domain-containing protein n=1 Tax=Aureoumbra lagunensis TaxID=44058 RepID=A0A7S3K780_9STRA